MIKYIGGIPGSGKNVISTRLALKHYNKTNFIFRRLIRKIFHKEIWVNNVNSTYPILIKKSKKKGDIYSNRVTIYDLVPRNMLRFLLMKRKHFMILKNIKNFLRK